MAGTAPLLQMEHFPHEILSLVCEQFSRDDLRNVRRVCRAFDAAAQTVLFRTIYLHVNVDSFEKLKAIARSASLSKHVRYIDYESAMIIPDDLAHDPQQSEFENWLSFRDQSVMDELSRDELETRYQLYQEHLRGQELLASSGFEDPIFLDAVKRFPSFMGFSCEAVPSWDPSTYSDVIEGRILKRPTCINRCDERFWPLLKATAQITKTTRVLRGHLTGLHDGSTSRLERFDEYDDTMLPKLRELSLKCDFPLTNQETQDLVRVLRSIPFLSSLNLSFPSAYSMPPQPSIPYGTNLLDLFETVPSWGRLRNLSLSHMVSNERDLKGFLKEHAASLRRLEIMDMYLHTPESKTESSNLDHPRTESGFWVSIINFLATEMKLSRVRFEGFLGSDEEYWITREYDSRFRDNDTDPEDTSDEEAGLTGQHNSKWRNNHQYPEDCLRYRIERYITQGGPCPFVEKKLHEKISDDCRGYCQHKDVEQHETEGEAEDHEDFSCEDWQEYPWTYQADYADDSWYSVSHIPYRNRTD